jgi:hypothetical protein
MLGGVEAVGGLHGALWTKLDKLPTPRTTNENEAWQDSATGYNRLQPGSAHAIGSEISTVLPNWRAPIV